MRSLKTTLLATAVIFAAAAPAVAYGPRSLTPIDGFYISMTSRQFNSVNQPLNAILAGYENNKITYVCAGNGSAKTPGKLINGNCYYANNGEEHKNTTYSMLTVDYSTGGYKWKLASTMVAYDQAITTRDWDAGDYLYHCRFIQTPFQTRVGKYLPGTGKCYWSYYGDEESTADATRFDILVPTSYRL